MLIPTTLYKAEHYLRTRLVVRYVIIFWSFVKKISSFCIIKNIKKLVMILIILFVNYWRQVVLQLAKPKIFTFRLSVREPLVQIHKIRMRWSWFKNTFRLFYFLVLVNAEVDLYEKLARRQCIFLLHSNIENVPSMQVTFLIWLHTKYITQ